MSELRFIRKHVGRSHSIVGRHSLLNRSISQSVLIFFTLLSFAQANTSAPIGQTYEEIRNTAAKLLRRDIREIATTVVSVKQFGAVGDGVTDDSEAIERATTEVANGEILVFPAGTYLQGRSISVRSPDVILWGFGAVVHGTNPDDHALIIRGNRSSVIGFRLTTVQTGRKLGDNQHRVVLLGDGNQALRNVIEGGAAGGIYMSGARHFRVDGNTVRDTLADGIHATDGSQHGIITNNIVRNTGDDLIAVVSYRTEHLASDILITKNDVAGNPWGRGIAVVGGRNITISDNAIRNVVAAAGVYVAREANYNTFGTFNIVVRQNLLEHIKTQGEVLDGQRRTRHGAFQIYADDQGNPELTVQGVLIQENVIHDVLNDGLQIVGGACHIEVYDNQFDMIGGRLLRTFNRGCAPERVSCKGNTLDGTLVSPSECSSFEDNISGASVQDR